MDLSNIGNFLENGLSTNLNLSAIDDMTAGISEKLDQALNGLCQ